MKDDLLFQSPGEAENELQWQHPDTVRFPILVDRDRYDCVKPVRTENRRRQ